MSALQLDDELNCEELRFLPARGHTVVDGEIVVGICYNSRFTKVPGGTICHFQTAADSAGEDRQQAVA